MKIHRLIPLDPVVATGCILSRNPPEDDLMTLQINPRSAGRDIALGWSALGAAALAVFAWAACCVLPLALSIAGMSLAGTAIIAGQRVWITLATVMVLAAGWALIWRRGQACAADAGCPRPSKLVIGLLSDRKST